MSENQTNVPQNENDWDEEEDINIIKSPLNEVVKKDCELEKKNELYSFWTVVVLLKKANITVNSYLLAVFDDIIPKFVMNFFNISSIDNVQITQAPNDAQRLTKQQIKNIKAVVQFLAKKEIKFNILHLEFNELYTYEASSVIFFSNFLNTFFLKVPKKQLYERCGTILYTDNTKFDDYEHFEELTSYSTFFRLVNFLKTNHAYFTDQQPQYTDQAFQELLQSVNVPMVINAEVLEACKKGKILDAVFYQLQFIFDSLDEQIMGPNNELIHVHIEQLIKEDFLRFIQSMRKIRILKPKEINKSMKVKRNVLNLQRKKSEIYISKKSGSSKVFNIQKDFDSSQISTYNKRHGIINNKQDDDKDENEKASNVPDDEKFWNKNAGKLGFDSGIPFDLENSENVKKQLEADWNNEMAKFPKMEEQSKQENQIEANPINIFKLFYYFEEENHWKLNQKDYSDFLYSLNFNINLLTPLVLLMNSYENDSKAILSQLISGTFPNLDDEFDRIFVYAIRNPKITNMIDCHFSNLNFSESIPIFLLVHVPKSKENLPNISSIIIQIYSFLSMFADLEVVILNNNRFSDQLEMTKLINKIANSYEKEKQLVIEKKKSIYNSEEFDENSLPFVFNKGNVLFLYELAGSSFENDQLISSNQFFKEIIAIDGRESEIHFIDSNNFISYGGFLNYIAKAKESYGINTLNDIKKNILFINQYRVSDFFIYIMRQKEQWKDELIKSINYRLTELKSKKDPKESEISILLKLGKEVANISPPYAIDFNNECNVILSELKKNISKSKRSIIESELKISALSHIDYSEKEIKKKQYWDRKQIELIKTSHEYFLHNEYLDIIKGITTSRVYNMVYEDNYDVVINQTEFDKNSLAKIFEQYEKDNEKLKQSIKKNILESTDKSLNYTMRETEHLREIKIIVESDDDFESQIPQDF